MVLSFIDIEIDKLRAQKQAPLTGEEIRVPARLRRLYGCGR